MSSAKATSPSTEPSSAEKSTSPSSSLLQKPTSSHIDASCHALEVLDQMDKGKSASSRLRKSERLSISATGMEPPRLPVQIQRKRSNSIGEVISDPVELPKSLGHKRSDLELTMMSRTGMPLMRGMSTRKGVPTVFEIEMMPSGFSKANVDELGFQDWTTRCAGSVGKFKAALEKGSSDLKVGASKVISQTRAPTSGEDCASFIS